MTVMEGVKAMTKVAEHKIYVTDDYSQFKKMEGNRAVKDGRVNKIIESINKVGYILSPILVNENMEVIDGQGRLGALERLKLPVYYIVQKGIGIKECQQMNIHQSNWTNYDYICSYAIRGSVSYQRLQSLCDTYKGLSIETVLASAMGRSSWNGIETKKLKEGKMVVTDTAYERARWELDYAQKLQHVAKTVGGRNSIFYIAVVYAYRNLDSEGRNRMETAIRQHAYDFPALNNVGDYLKHFDGYYNEGLSKAKRIKLAVQWELDQM